ncbi:hypothetical protein [Psychrobacillus sp. OK032]|uniref:hypothetical protein n=1 Tax=Psychrobacillus sp. OK032 TaxID=1884358 RepID=UPI0008C380F5|nr:hypothetical protein [Psychrobacillus sp. OK032]SER87411.1 hypothetical protein SAMN05518872_102436 [Psychrobacillus sp. OK032]
MTRDIEAATAYIRLNTLDNEDFIDGDVERKTALLNVSDRTLKRKFPGLTIPDEANYLFAATLAGAFNDTNKLAQQGVASFSVKGIAFTFKDWAKKELDAFIPADAIELIGAENGVNLSAGRSIKWVTL